MRYGTIGSCQSAATSEIVLVVLVTSLTHVSGAIASVQTFTFTFTFTLVQCFNRCITILHKKGCENTSETD